MEKHYFKKYLKKNQHEEPFKYEWKGKRGQEKRNESVLERQVQWEGPLLDSFSTIHIV